MSNRFRSIALVLTVAFALAACSSDGSDATTEPATGDTTVEDGAMADGEMPMNMGNPQATPADQVADARIASGVFELLDTRPEGYDDATGTATIARSDAGTTITVELEGLLPDTGYISHLHDGPCTENGADHYMFDAAGPAMPPNEIHLAFTSEADGHGFMTAENDQTAGPEGRSVVVHPVDLLDNKIACAQF